MGCKEWLTGPILAEKNIVPKAPRTTYYTISLVAMMWRIYKFTARRPKARPQFKRKKICLIPKTLYCWLISFRQEGQKRRQLANQHFGLISLIQVRKKNVVATTKTKIYWIFLHWIVNLLLLGSDLYCLLWNLPVYIPYTLAEKTHLILLQKNITKIKKYII